MKKLIGIGLVLAMMAMVLSAGVVSAADPLVSVTADTPGGALSVTVSGIDTSVCHPGSIGQTDTFTAVGGFTASFQSSVGPYGGLHSTVNANGAYSNPAGFQLDSYQDFNILSGNHNYNTEGYFTAIAENLSDDQVAMNLKTAGSMYVWSEATNPSWAPGLIGEYVYKGSQIDVNGILTAQLQQSVNTDGIADIHNSNIWGWGIRETGTLTTNYNGGIRNVSATGDGAFTLAGFGANELNINGTVNTSSGSVATTGAYPAGGAMSIIMNFVNGMNGNYSMNSR